MKIVLVTGGFDPLHSGHIKYFEEARKLGDQLIIGLNSDAWLTRKKGRPFMKWEDRLSVVRNIKGVNWTVQFDDSDGTAKDAIRKVRLNYPNDTIIFANGGDRTANNIPEMDIKDDHLKFVFGVGGENKMNSSSWILEEWKAPKTNRAWGYYRVLHENSKEVKVKELTVEPGACLSMQKHEHRSEFWFVAEGQASVYTDIDNEAVHIGHYDKFQHLFIDKHQWHRLCNENTVPLKLVEIQYGEMCVEEDIKRK
jgi:D-beta-D-heptose 7-phosphate kinase/D-beta-D-heptose 1-phosphate adenosyltransferase